jgi:cell division protein FtsL
VRPFLRLAFRQPSPTRDPTALDSERTSSRAATFSASRVVLLSRSVVVIFAVLSIAIIYFATIAYAIILT